MSTLFNLPDETTARPAGERRAKVADLNAIIKRARDIMRKDSGLNGDIERIPQFSWLLFLKALDAQEEDREDFGEGTFEPLIEEPYRWRDWAGCPEKQRRTGDTLTEFVNADLLPYLARRSGSSELDVIGTIFKEVQNRMRSGYLLRSVVDTIAGIDFHAQSEVYTMAHVYESMLQELRDAAGDSGEFYTPRAVVRFMVRMTDPKPHEMVLDPACGTGGFLVETFEYLRKQYADGMSAEEANAIDINLQGIEKKSLPFLLATMNLLLHGVNRPNLTLDNTLHHPIASHRHHRVDVVLTNPPFGGEEESRVLKNFPTEKRTNDTAWLFLQVIMERLKEGGRCAVVVPNNILFEGGVGEKVRRQLLDNFDLHTVLRLPNGVFAPYTLIPSNVLFFDRTGPTKATWFYELPLPDGRRNFTKTKPMTDAHLGDIEAWWGGSERTSRVENRYAWRVPRKALNELLDLDVRNPYQDDAQVHREPADIIRELIQTEEGILALLRKVQEDLRGSDQ
ncbi:N-6 DNA methylase [Streptomyces sp. NPDC058128]|uniref:type I restriction-modification system subunit M n=1 Tax=Streptomyces sp. NPDC058128 TaxID=3346352 RepID=UPI0036F0009D